MKLVSGRCPNCGGEVQLDESKEKGFCMHCGSSIRVHDAVQKLKIEMSGKIEVDGINTVKQLKANAQKSFDVKQYSHAEGQWARATHIDVTDHESHWGIMRCKMKHNPKHLIHDFNKHPAYAYAPLDVRKRYEAEIKKHNDAITSESDAKKKAVIRFRLIMFVWLIVGLGLGLALEGLGLGIAAAIAGVLVVIPILYWIVMILRVLWEMFGW